MKLISLRTNVIHIQSNTRLIRTPRYYLQFSLSIGTFYLSQLAKYIIPENIYKPNFVSLWVFVGAAASFTAKIHLLKLSRNEKPFWIKQWISTDISSNGRQSERARWQAPPGMKIVGSGKSKGKVPSGRYDIFWKLHNTSTLKYRQWTLISCLINRFS